MSDHEFKLPYCFVIRSFSSPSLAAMSGRRALHFVLKVGDRREFMSFLKDTLGMHVLRHEEFDSGCKATCNGPYQNKWSKTMIGYGPEVTTCCKTCHVGRAS